MKKYFLLFFLFAFCRISFGQLSGIYSIGTNTIPGEAGHYATISAAVIGVNAVGVSGPTTFYFTDNGTYVDTAVSLGCTGTSATNTITFKPYTGINCTIDLTSIVSKSIDGLWVIGSPNNLTTNLVSTNYVTIDGSNTVNGTTKNLTIQNPSDLAQRSVIRVFGDNDHVTIKNCIIVNRSTSGNTAAPINVTNFFSTVTSLNYSPDYLTITNNTLSSDVSNGSAGIHMANSGTPTVGSTGLVVSYNIITARQRGMFVSYTNDGNIFNNTFSVNSYTSQGSVGITLQTNFGTAGTFNVYNNTFTALTSQNITAGTSNGIIGIDNQCVTPKVVNIYNNMLAGFGCAAATTNTKIYGIRSSGSSTCSIYYNTIYFPDMTDMTVFGTSYLAGIVYASTGEIGPAAGGICDVKNNIVIVNETSMKIHAIKRAGTTGTFTANYNDYFVNPVDTAAYIGFFNAADYKTFSMWKTASLADSSSKNIPVTFVSETDLHLAGVSVGERQLAGIPLAGYLTDIDGHTRNANFPYIGCDENTNAPLPIELSSFSSRVSGNAITLNWNTATEKNSNRFEIERNSNNSAFVRIAEVKAAGNSISPVQYSFSDKNLATGKYQYRLKMVDHNGTFEYSAVINVEVSQPKEFALAQNYPNPFNPSTKINYSLASDSKVQLLIYNSLGELVKSLVNENQSSGDYSVDFNASGLSSGTYFYKIIAGDYVKVNKMLLLK